MSGTMEVFLRGGILLIAIFLFLIIWQKVEERKNNKKK